jgi:hypothetical protein
MDDHRTGEGMFDLRAKLDTDLLGIRTLCDCHSPARMAVATLTLVDLDVLIYLCDESAEPAVELEEAQG